MTKLSTLSTFKDSYSYTEFVKESYIIEQSLNEGFFSDSVDKLKTKFKKVYQLIQELSSKFKIDIKSLIELFRIKEIFTFFKKLSFSTTKFLKVVKDGYKALLSVQDIIAEWISEQKIVKFTEAKIKQLDEFLSKHPTIKRISGLVVAGMLVYIWFNMSFGGDLDGDFDNSYLIGALIGDYTLTDIFTGPSGIKMLTLFATGVLTGVSFPWPGHSLFQFIYSLLYSVLKVHKKKNPELYQKFQQKLPSIK